MKMSAKQKFLKARKEGPKEVNNDYLVLAHCDHKPDIVISFSRENELLEVMEKVERKYIHDNLSFITGITNLGGGRTQADLDNTPHQENGMNWDNGMYKIQVIPSCFEQYKMMKKSGLKRGEILNAKVTY